MNPAIAQFADEFRRMWYRMRRSTTSLIGMGLVCLVLASAVFAPWLAPYPEDVGRGVKFWQAHRPPSKDHWFGTDHIGRDILSRVMFGARISLLLGFAVLGLAVAIGVPLGLIAGLWGGRVNTVIMRITDVFLAIPDTLLALAVASALSYTLTNAMFAIAFAWWPWYARLVQGEVLKVKEEIYVQASRSLGASKWRIAFKDVLPNIMSPLVVKITLDMGFVILVGASLSFLGLGPQPPTPSWGSMIAEGRLYLPDSWWIATFPGLAIFVTVLGFNLLGDGLRDVLDVDLDRWN